MKTVATEIYAPDDTTTATMSRIRHLWKKYAPTFLRMPEEAEGKTRVLQALDPEKKRRIFSALKWGMSTKEICAEVGVSADAVKNVRRAHGLKPNGQKRVAYSDELLQQAVLLRAQNKTWREVGKLLNVNPKALENRIRKEKG